MATGTLSLPSTFVQTRESTQELVHSYRSFGHVLCRLRAVEDVLATKDPSFVTCPHCLSMKKFLV